LKEPKQELSIQNKESKFKLQLPTQTNAVSLRRALLRRVGTSPTVAEARTLGVQFLSERGFSKRRTHLLLVLAFAWFVPISERLRRKNRNKNYRSRKRNPNSNGNYPPE
jgi:hypothetical protein